MSLQINLRRLGGGGGSISTHFSVFRMMCKACLSVYHVCSYSKKPLWVQVRELEDLMANDDAWANVPEREQEEKENVLRQESE